MLGRRLGRALTITPELVPPVTTSAEVVAATEVSARRTAASMSGGRSSWFALPVTLSTTDGRGSFQYFASSRATRPGGVLSRCGARRREQQMACCSRVRHAPLVRAVLTPRRAAGCCPDPSACCPGPAARCPDPVARPRLLS